MSEKVTRCMERNWSRFRIAFSHHFLALSWEDIPVNLRHDTHGVSLALLFGGYFGSRLLL
jgi:hypothetical protein